jgi:hypothetical protein
MIAATRPKVTSRATAATVAPPADAIDTAPSTLPTDMYGNQRESFCARFFDFTSTMPAT